MPRLANAALALLLLLTSGLCLTALTSMTVAPWGDVLVGVLAADTLLFFLPVRAKTRDFVLAAIAFAVAVAGTVFSFSQIPNTGQTYENGRWVDISAPDPVAAAIFAAVIALTIVAPYLAALLIWKRVVWKTRLPQSFHIS